MNDKLEQYLEYAQFLRADSKITYWVKHTLSNYIKENNPTTEEVEHILDYLVSPEASDTTKMSYEAAKHNSEKWTKTLMKKGEHIKESSDDTKIVLDFKDGFKIVQLVGKNAYEREGYLMRNCVASYYGKSTEIYSLRDKDNMPHCTMEKDQQVKGKGNGDIHPKYVDYVVKFLEYAGMSVGDSEMAHLGYMNVSKFKKYLSKEIKLYQGKYLPQNEKLIDKEGNEFASLDLLDVKPLVKETIDGEIKLNFDLSQFIPLAINFLFKYSKKTDKSISASSGNSAQIGSSGYYAQIGSSGNYAKIGSSGDYAKIGSSGYYAQIGSSGNSAQIGSSGDSAQIGSSGNYAKIGSSGYSAQIGSSGNYAKIGSSGYYAQIGSSGNSAQIGSSGDSAQIGSSGNYAKIGSSGNSAQIGSSGYYAQIGSSGNYAKIGSSGDYAKIGSSGYYAQIEASGENSVVAAIGYNGKIKGKKGNWITLAEYDSNGKPVCVKSAQIDGKTIKEDTWYELKNKEFTEVN